MACGMKNSEPLWLWGYWAVETWLIGAKYSKHDMLWLS